MSIDGQLRKDGKHAVILERMQNISRQIIFDVSSPIEFALESGGFHRGRFVNRKFVDAMSRKEPIKPAVKL